jgi:hypothetical protein
MRTDHGRVRKENQSTEKPSTEYSWKEWTKKIKREEKAFGKQDRRLANNERWRTRRQVEEQTKEKQRFDGNQR